ncbi:MAG TPA: lytic transglycosylase domain-containing protein [Solirubrobacteraceae bacterium]|nr:lytic transglycosylase domain-containing protein [Solirubrobacteraceae bacterium]
MSAQAVSGAGAATSPGELAVLQRVQQLQALIESARQVSSGGVVSTGATASSYSQATGSDFASALQAATSADAAGVAEPADIAYEAAQGGSAGGESGEYAAQIDQAAARNGLDPAVLHGLIQQESGFDPSATSSAGASGLTQLMPGTAASLGVADPLNPGESIEGGARYLGELMAQFGDNSEEALAAYNAGPGAVQQYGGVPPYAETRSYVSNVLANAEAYRQSHPATATAESLA